MDFSSLMDVLANFKTGRVIAYLENLNIGEVLHNRWVLGSLAALALIALVMRWRVLLATILSVTGFAGLVNYTMQRGATLDSLGSETLMIFVAGGVCLIFVVIYLLFVKGD